MMVIRFRSSEEHGDLLKKVKKMKMFTEDLQDMLEQCEEEDTDYREDMRYRRDSDDSRMSSRYGYRRRM